MHEGQNVTPRETKAQRAERLKKLKNPWQAFEEIERFALEGWESIPAEWLSTYFRWWGVYTQGDGAGVLGGKGGEGKAVPYFMLRIRIPGGLLDSHQMREIAGVAADHARGVADLTVRQNIQLHWITLESLPGILRRLEKVGLSTLAACGDTTRNITGCPLAGIDGGEICDATPLVCQVDTMLAGHADFYNLPRKFKVTISGCRTWCSYPEINDVGLMAQARRSGRRRDVGFALRVGGGLSSEPHLSVRLPVFVQWDQVAPVVHAIATIFRDSECLRESRERARLKYLFTRYGWTADSFLAAIEQRLGYPLDPPEAEALPDDFYRDHVGIYPQKQPGLYYAGAAVLRGRITSSQMLAAAEAAERWGHGDLRITTGQNLLIVNIPKHNVDPVAAELHSAGLPLAGSPFWRGMIACTGTEFCKLAITETKSYSQWLTEQLQARLPGFREPLRIHVTGCPNSCGQHWIADIGLEGKKIKQGARMVDAYYFCVGGSVGAQQAIARPTGFRCASDDVPEAITRLLVAYLELRDEDENFRAFCMRQTDAELRALLAGEMLAPVPRDLPGGRLPMGLEM